MLKFWIFLLFIPLSSFAQNVITGKVINTTTGAPISDASVFFNNTTSGSKTLTDGSFTLSNVHDGGYKLIVSCVGYETYIQTIIINKNIHLEDIMLVPKVAELGEVQITSKPRAINPLYLKVFTNEFLGQTKNARECKILNPRVIHFVYDATTEKLTATTSKFLIIENKALGYRIKYLLVSFSNDPRWGRTTYTGLSVFEQMDSTAAQQLIWNKARIETYRNSTMHFLRACISGQFDGEHFYVWKVVRTPAENRPTDSVLRERLNKLDDYSNGSAELSKWLKMAKQPPYQQTVDNKPPEINEYVKRTDQKGIYAFGFPYTLMINYNNDGNGSDRNSSFVTFVQPYAYFDINGILLTPENCIIEGFWGKKRMGELLPDDYKLPDKF